MAYEARMAAFNQRLEARKREEEALGLPAIEAEQEEIDTRMFAIEDRIEALVSPALEKIAAMTLLACVRMSCRQHSFGAGYQDGGLAALKGLRPFICGPVADAVADHLDNEDRPFCRSPLWGSYWPEGEA